MTGDLHQNAPCAPPPVSEMRPQNDPSKCACGGQNAFGGLSGDAEDLRMFVEESGADVLLLQELSIHYDSSFSFSSPPGFQHVSDPYGKSAVLFPASWTCSDVTRSDECDDPVSRLHSSAATLWRPGSAVPLRVCSFYRSPSGKPPAEDWQALLSAPLKHSVVGGDANVSSGWWGGATRGPYERLVESEILTAMSTRGWVIANDGSPSRVVAGAKPSHIDVTWCSTVQSALLTDARFAAPGYPSDHLQHAQVFKYSALDCPTIDAKHNAPRINTRAPDELWVAYAARLDRDLLAWEARFPTPLAPVRLSQAHRALIELVRRAAALTLGTFQPTDPSQRPPAPIGPEVRAAKTSYLRALRQWTKSRLDLDKERLRAARRAKEAAWARHYARVAGGRAAALRHGDRRGLWKMWKRATKPSLSSRPAVIKTGTTEARTAEEQAQLLCDAMFPDTPPSAPSLKFACDPRARGNEELAGVFTAGDLEDALDKAAAGKAPGPLGLPVELFTKGGRRVRTCLLSIFNTSWQSAAIPSAWRSRSVSPVLKNGKSPTQSSSYRPIALLEPDFKLMLEMMRSRIELHVETQGLLSAAQCGFRRRRSVLHAQLALAEDGYGAFARNEDLGVVFFDLKGAFDTVPHARLLSKLQDQYMLPPRCLAWIEASLGPLVSVVKWAGADSAPKVALRGLSQGSPLSPLLFALYLNDLTSSLPPAVGCALYADDIAVWKRAPRRDTKLQKAVSEVCEWAERN